jgi:hypothetical protein
MFYIGGAGGKKRAVREILNRKEEENVVVEDDRDKASRSTSNSPSRSRSRSRVSHASSDIVEHDTDTDTDTDTEMDEDTFNVVDGDDDVNDDPLNNDPDENDYITTLSRISTDGHHHHYSFTEDELDYDIEEFTDQHPEIKDYELVIYQINTNTNTPFLQFLFYYDKPRCRLPYIQHNSKHNIRKESDKIMDKLFTSKYRYKGFFHDELTDKCFLFYEKYFHAVDSETTANIARISLQKSHNWFWVCTTEIIYQRKYMNIPIDEDAIDFFIAYPTIGILQATLPRRGSLRKGGGNRFQSVHIEAPIVLYYGSSFCYAKNTALYGLKREPIIARYGPFYYFTTLEHSYYWACYHKSLHTGTKNRETDNGGISRYAVFTKRMKTVFTDDEYNRDIVKKYTDRKNMFETKINEYRQIQETFHPGIYDSIYGYDYTWTTSYDTIYNGYYHANNNILRPVWCVNDHHNFQLLSYYEVDADKIPEKYDPKYTDYQIM